MHLGLTSQGHWQSILYNKDKALIRKHFMSSERHAAGSCQQIQQAQQDIIRDIHS